MLLLVIKPTTVVSPANLMIELGGVHGHAVVGEQGVQEGVVGPQCCGSSRWRGSPIRKSRTQLHRVGLRPRAYSLMTSLEGTKSNHILFVTYTWLADVNASVAKCLCF